MILKYLSPRQWVLVAVCGLFILLQVFLDLRIPEYMNAMTDAILNDNIQDVMGIYGTKMALCAILSLIASLIAGYIAAYVTSQLCKELRIRQFEKVQQFSSEDVGDLTIASLITRSTSDVYQIQIYVARGMLIFIRAPILAVWALCKIAGSNWQWTAATAVAVVIIIIVVMFAVFVAVMTFFSVLRIVLIVVMMVLVFIFVIVIIFTGFEFLTPACRCVNFIKIKAACFENVLYINITMACFDNLNPRMQHFNYFAYLLKFIFRNKVFFIDDKCRTEFNLLN